MAGAGSAEGTISATKKESLPFSPLDEKCAASEEFLAKSVDSGGSMVFIPPCPASDVVAIAGR